MLLLTADVVEGEEEMVIYRKLGRELNFHFFIKVRRLIMVCNSCVHFLQKFRPTGLPKDDLFVNMEETKLRGIWGSMNMCCYTNRILTSQSCSL